jgi:hypothetical protein
MRPDEPPPGPVLPVPDDFTPESAAAPAASLEPWILAEMKGPDDTPRYRVAAALDEIAEMALSTITYHHAQVEQGGFRSSNEEAHHLKMVWNAWRVLRAAARPWQ